MRVVQVQFVGHQIEAGQQPATERHQRAGDAAGRAGAVDLAHVDAVVLLVDLGQASQATGQQLHLRR